MATFTITAETRIDTLSGKGGGDTYTINGGTLIIDQDSRYGLNQSATTALGAITISSTLGGICRIDGRYTRIIPFDTGSGNVPAAGTKISQGAVTGKLIGVWTAVNVAPTAAGAAMPSSGWIKIKEASQVPGFSAGALSGIGANATGEDKAGWIEVVADESKTCTVPRLGAFEIKGDWFEVGTTDGSATTTYQLPTNGNTMSSGSYLPGVYVHDGEAGDTDANYEFYPSVGACSGVGCIATDAVRGKVCWISAAGLVQFGSDAINGGANTVGYVPPSGRKIRIGNVICHNCTTAARATNALPNSTLSTRYDFTTTGGGAVSIDKAMIGWYLSFSYTKSCALNCTGTFESIYFNMPGSAPVLTRCGVGNAATNRQAALNCIASFTGLTVEDCVFARIGGGGSTHTFTLADTFGARLYNNRTYFHTSFISAQYTISLTRCTDLICDGLTYGNGGITGTYNVDITFRNLRPYGSSGSLSRMEAVIVASSGTTNLLVDGIYPVDDDSYPSGQTFYVSSYGAANLTLRNVGTPEAPANMGGVAELAYLNASNAQNIKIQRCWMTNIPSSMVINPGSNTHNGVSIENVYADAYTAAIYNPSSNKLRIRGLTMTGFVTSISTLRYGHFWHDYFSAETTGVICIDMVEPDTVIAPYVTLGGGAAYTGTGGIYMPTVGDSITMEMDYFALGHTEFRNIAPAINGGGSISNFSLEYQIDLNDGNGWNGTWKTLDTTNLLSEMVDYTKGVKLKARMTTTTANTSAVTTLAIYTTTTAEAQQTLYPLASCAVQVTNLATGSRVKVVKVSDGAVLFNGAESSGSVTFSTSYEGLIEIDVRKASSSPYYRPFVSRGTTVDGETLVITALQQLDE